MLRTVRCIGAIRDDQNRLRHDWVLRPPKRYTSATPVASLQIFEGSRGGQTAANEWCPRTFVIINTSLPVVFVKPWPLPRLKLATQGVQNRQYPMFGPTTSHTTVLDPYIAGFESSRHHEAKSPGYRRTGSGPLVYFYHPEAANGFSNKMGLYSLDVVFLEIVM